MTTKTIGTEFRDQEWELQITDSAVLVLARRSPFHSFHRVADGFWNGESLVLRPGRGQVTKSDVRNLETVLQTCLQG